jgi:5-formyltetrahydrofolate cyclo-ligase
MLSLVGVYEGEDLMQGLILYRDPQREFKWVLLDSLHADLATRYYIEYIQEMTEAISLFEIMEIFEDEEKVKEEEKDFGLDLDE